MGDVPDPAGTYASECLLCEDGRDFLWPQKPCSGCGGTGEQVSEFVKVGPCEYEYRELGAQVEMEEVA